MSWQLEKTIWRNAITKKLTSPGDPEAVPETVLSKKLRRHPSSGRLVLVFRDGEGQVQIEFLEPRSGPISDPWRGLGPLFETTG